MAEGNVRKLVTTRIGYSKSVQVQTLESKLVAIEYGAALLEESQGNFVTRTRAELELAKNFDECRKYMDRVIKVKDSRMLLKAITDENCRQFAKLMKLCEKVQLTSDHDRRRQSCLRQCDRVKRVIEDLGMVQQLKYCLEQQEALLGCQAGKENAEMDDVFCCEASNSFADEGAIEHLAGATVAGTEAIIAEEEGDIQKAVQRYEEANDCISAMIALGRAAGSLSKGRSGSVIEQDVEKLQVFKAQISGRISRLATLEHGEMLNVPVSEDICPPVLGLHENEKTRSKVIRSCASIEVRRSTLLAKPESERMGERASSMSTTYTSGSSASSLPSSSQGNSVILGPFGILLAVGASAHSTGRANTAGKRSGGARAKGPGHHMARSLKAQTARVRAHSENFKSRAKAAGTAPTASRARSQGPGDAESWWEEGGARSLDDFLDAEEDICGGLSTVIPYPSRSVDRMETIDSQCTLFDNDD